MDVLGADCRGEKLCRARTEATKGKGLWESSGTVGEQRASGGWEFKEELLVSCCC